MTRRHSVCGWLLGSVGGRRTPVSLMDLHVSGSLHSKV